MIKTLLKFLMVFFIAPIGAAGQYAPDFSGTDSNGNEISLYDDYLNDGKTVVIEFFLVDCAPCGDIASDIEAFYQDWGAGSSVEFIGVSNEDDDPAILDYRLEFGSSYPMIGTEGSGIAIHDLFNSGDYGMFYGHPTFIVIAPDGTMDYDPREDDIEPLVLINSILEDVVANGTVSSKEHNKLEVNFGPNPFTDELSINTSKQGELAVFSLPGELVYTNVMTTERTNRYDLTTLNSGVYFLKFNTGDEVITRRIVKE